MKKLVRKCYDYRFIFTSGFYYAKAIKKYAEQFPHVIVTFRAEFTFAWLLHEVTEVCEVWEKGVLIIMHCSVFQYCDYGNGESIVIDRMLAGIIKIDFWNLI